MSVVKIFLLSCLYFVEPALPMEVQKPPVQETGAATWYGDGNWHGEITASQERFRPYEEITCAHRTLPFDTVILVEHVDTGRMIWCRINDRGPYMSIDEDGVRHFQPPGTTPGEGKQWHGVLDMSAKAAQALGTYDEGLFEVRLRYWHPSSTSDPFAFLHTQ